MLVLLPLLVQLADLGLRRDERAVDAGHFADYPTLGVDANALYIGTNNFTMGNAGTFANTTGYVVNKANLLANTLTVTAFRGLATTTVAGPLTPQGVSNDDATFAVTLTKTWTLVTVPFAMIKPVPFGYRAAQQHPPALDPTSIYQMQFSFQNPSAFDMWIDEISFTP